MASAILRRVLSLACALATRDHRSLGAALDRSLGVSDAAPARSRRARSRDALEIRAGHSGGSGFKRRRPAVLGGGG